MNRRRFADALAIEVEMGMVIMNKGRAFLPAFSCFALLPLLCGAAADPADHLLDPYAGVLVESDSNLFAVAPGFAVLDPHGVPRLSDTVTTYKGGVDLNYLFDLQRVYGTFEGRELEYDRFTNLDHSEYLIDLGLDWKLTTRFDGMVDVRREKRIIAFADADLTALEVQTDQVIGGTFNVAMTPEWRLETQANLHTLDYPIAGSPELRLQEGLEGIGVKYVGIANLAYGIEGTHVDGGYEGVPGSSGYKQNTYQFAAKYKIAAVTQLNAAIGYTVRNIEGDSSSVSGVTGAFGYDRQLTGKTSLSLKVQRAVDSYYTAVSSEIDTSGSASVNWQATPKISVALNYQRVHSVFEGESLQDALTSGRKDNASFSGVELRYQPLRWLVVRPYLKRQVRESNLNEFTYNNTELGVELLAARGQRAH